MTRDIEGKGLLQPDERGKIVRFAGSGQPVERRVRSFDVSTMMFTVVKFHDS